MRIAIFVPNFSGFSGDARVALPQAQQLVAEGNQVKIFALSANLFPENVKVSVLGMPRSPFLQRVYRLIFPINIFATRKVLAELNDYDVIISHLYPMNWLAYLAKKRFGMKYVFWYHGIPDPNLYSNLTERIYMKLFVWLTIKSISNADSVISVSKYGRSQLLGYSGPDSIVIYNQPDPKIFNRENDGRVLREKYNLGDSIVFLNVGRVCRLKGMHILSDAMPLIAAKIPHSKLIIVGEITDKAYADELIKRSGENLIMTGYVDHRELAKYYAMSDIYVTASRSECCPLPLMEAQMSGKPVVASDIEPHRELIDENGILVPKCDAETFAESCIQMAIKVSKKPGDD